MTLTLKDWKSSQKFLEQQLVHQIEVPLNNLQANQQRWKIV